MNKHAVREMRSFYWWLAKGAAIVIPILGLVFATGYALWWINWNVGTEWAWGSVLVPAFVIGNLVAYFGMAHDDKRRQRQQAEWDRERQIRITAHEEWVKNREEQPQWEASG